MPDTAISRKKGIGNTEGCDFRRRVANTTTCRDSVGATFVDVLHQFTNEGVGDAEGDFLAIQGIWDTVKSDSCVIELK